MEYLSAAGYYFAGVILGIIPPALWFAFRRRFQSMLFPAILMHLSLLAWFLIARTDRFGANGYGPFADSFLFTPYFLVYPWLLIVLAFIAWPRRAVRSLAIVIIALSTAAIAYQANRELAWTLPSRLSGKTPHPYRQNSPILPMLVTAGFPLAVGLYFAGKVPLAKRRVKSGQQPV